MKLCYTCQQTRDESEFNKNKSRRDGLNSICKSCSKKRSQRYYEENKEHHKAVVLENKRQYVKELVEEINLYKSNKGCQFCPEKDSVCLDFHHVGSKDGNVSKFVKSNQRSKTWSEIKKCIVVCANCHRKIHAGKISHP